MRINNNIDSMTTRNSLFLVNREMGKSIQKIATGLRINSAADDAAGLGVSENLRTQVRGMGQALKNTQDAMALLNIADGALNEQAAILQRMRELIIQAKNDTYTQTERNYMGQEFEALVSEIDRIGATTSYNGMSLFAAPETVYGAGNTTYPFSRPQLTPHESADQSVVYGAGNESDSNFGPNDISSSNHFNMMIGGNYEQADIDAFYDLRASYQKTSSNMLTIQLGQMDANGILSPEGSAWTNARAIFSFSWDPVNDLEDMGIDFALGGDGTGSVATLSDKLDMALKVIDGKSINPDIADFLFAFGGGNSNVTGIERVNRMRANIGAMVNRLESTVNNLQNQITNTQSAESIIRDADFAAETVNFSRQQILTQSATAMLSQANTSPQSVLQLLQ